jgi:hypothetical protein
MSPPGSTTGATTMTPGRHSTTTRPRTGATGASSRPGRRDAGWWAPRSVARPLTDPFHELRVVRGCVAVVALALGAYCLMAAATAPEAPSASASRDPQELVLTAR